MNTQSLNESIERYFQAWNQTGIATIDATLQLCWVAGGTYIDPLNALTGVDGLAAIIQQTQEGSPGRVVTLTSRVDHYHSNGRYTWAFTKPNGDKTEGFDYIEYDVDNRITRLVSFFGGMS